MIKYNNSNINDWNFGSDNIAKAYYNGDVCYQKIESGSTPPTPVIPSGYTEVEYIQCGSGTTSTNGGLQLLTNVTADYYFEVESQLINTSNSPSIVSEKSYVEVVSYQMGLCYYTSNLYLDYGGARLSTNINNTTQREKHTYGAGHISGSSYPTLVGVTIDGVVNNTTNATVSIEGLPYLVGDLEYSGHSASDVSTNKGNLAIMKIYSVKIYTDYGDTLVGDYIPVINSDNVVTLYDKVSGNYATPYGTLIAGPEKT